MSKRKRLRKNLKLSVHPKNYDFPHNYRNIPVHPSYWTVKYILWVGVITMTLLTLLNAIYPGNPKLNSLKLALLSQTHSIAAHLNLAQFYLNSNSYTEAREELTITQALAAKTPIEGTVLGISEDLLKNVQQAPHKIEAKIAYWEGIIAKWQNYRDAYLQLSSLTYQLNRITEAKQYLQKALELDPNHPASQKLEEFFKQFATSNSPL